MREDKNENRWDKLLQIHTMGRDDSRSDLYRYPYEPTPYCVLERMANTWMIRKGNTLLDYGCGKGRVDFFLSAQTRCQSIGVEYDDRIYAKAMENKKAAASGARTEFVLESAENLPDFIRPCAASKRRLTIHFCGVRLLTLAKSRLKVARLRPV